MVHDRVKLTTNASGAVTALSRPFSGYLMGIYFELGTLAAGATDLTITIDETGAAVVTLTNAAAGWFVPTLPTADATGAARLFAAGGTAVASPIPVHGAIRTVVAQGGNAGTGYVTFYCEGED